MDPGLTILRENAPGEELDYGFVMECLKAYKNPRVKLTHLLKVNALIRVKKGIYIFGKPFAKSAYSPEVLANMIYGPSYVSLEWACQYYHLIPEKVTTITSVTTQRSRQFQTPVGLFTYDHLRQSAYPVGVTRVQFSSTKGGLMATPEKALTDLLVLRRGAFTSKKSFEEVLLDDLRIEEDDMQALHLDLLQEIYRAHPHSAIRHLLGWLQDE